MKREGSYPVLFYPIMTYISAIYYNINITFQWKKTRMEIKDLLEIMTDNKYG